MNTVPSSFDHAASALAREGWCVLPRILEPEQTRALADECAAAHVAHRMTPARTGTERVASALRGDQTRWFEMNALSAPQRALVDYLDALRLTLNQTLMLGLVESEAHYAVYPPGAGYARHLDRLRHSDARVLSAVFYLNEEWTEGDGGALRLYLPDGTHRDVFPHAGTLVLFLSGQFEHEVLPATRTRMSVAVWMRQRELGFRQS